MRKTWLMQFWPTLAIGVAPGMARSQQSRLMTYSAAQTWTGDLFAF